MLIVEDAGFDAEDQFRSWDIPAEMQGSFHCYGLGIDTVLGGGNVAAVRNIIMWEVLSKGVNVSP